MSGKRISIRARRAVSGYLFILPFIIGFLCFMLLDNDLLFRVHKLFQRVRLDAGFDSRILFHSLRFSAEILKLRTVL